MGDTTTPAQADPFGDVNAELVDPRPAGFLAEVGAAQEAQADAERAIAQAGQDQMSGGVPLDMDPVSGERWDDGLEAEAPSAAERIAHLEWLLDRASGNLADQAQLIQDQKADRDQLRDQLQERDAWIVKLETTLADTRQQTREQATRAGRLDEQLGQAQARIAELETALATTWTEVQADRKRQADRIAVLEDRLARVAVYAARLENLDRAGTERVNSFQAAETLKAILAS